jgi:branched-chain amino acid transport system ATP-binding protein
VGRTFQTLQVFGKMTVRDNLIVAAQEHQGSMFSRMFAPGDSGLGARADALIDQFRIRHVADKKAGELSYGQQKLVDIAMAFMSEPDLVLLDEPCAGVNPSLVGGISTLLKELNRNPRIWARAAFVVIEHNMDFVMDLCHRIMVMVEGQVMAIGTPEEIRGNKQVLDAYLSRELSMPASPRGTDDVPSDEGLTPASNSTTWSPATRIS